MAFRTSDKEFERRAKVWEQIESKGIEGIELERPKTRRLKG